ncbi:M48 family metallopeptidase [Thermomonas sp.]|uniref:M48 family metallopeptidase n=1 Tax=Thermomonas sp. TaxID=1971895 RepID=UPI00391BA6C0
MTPNPMGNRRGGLRLWVLVLFAGYAAYYWFSNRSVDPLTGETVVIDKSISPEQETALGLQAYQQVLQQERPLPADAEVSRQVTAIAGRLIDRIPPVSDALAAEHGLQASHIEKTFDWKVTVLQSDQVNAFCLPGGKMAVYTGLLPVARNADAVAVVMGHEIAHALLRHGAQRMTRGKLEQLGQMAGAASGMDQGTLQTVMSAYGYGSALPYARSQETQADELGLMLAAAACFDPREAVPLWERMDRNAGGNAPPEFASTHPSAGTRIQQLEALMPKALAYRAKFCPEAPTPAG